MKETEITKVKKEFRNYFKKNLREDVVYSFICGSSVYSKNCKKSSDIDIVLVLYKRSIRKMSIVKDFVKFYVKQNIVFDYLPDLDFPGEYTTLKEIKDALNCRGFNTRDGRLFLRNLSYKDFFKNSELWFRVWLSMQAFSVFCYGDYKKFFQNKILAWKTVILYIISSHNISDTISVDEVIKYIINNKEKNVGFGITNKYTMFREKEEEFIKVALKELCKDDFLHLKSEYKYKINLKKVLHWENNIVINLEKNKYKAFLSLDTKKIGVLSKIAKEQYEKFKNRG
jgi:hypothetical protein